MGTYFGAFLDDAYTDFLTSVGGFCFRRQAADSLQGRRRR